MRMAPVRQLWDLAEKIRENEFTRHEAADRMRDLADELAGEVIGVAGRPRTDGPEMDYQRAFERRQLLKIIENLSSSQSRGVDVGEISSVIYAMREQAERVSSEFMCDHLVGWAQRLEDALKGKS